MNEKETEILLALYKEQSPVKYAAKLEAGQFDKYKAKPVKEEKPNKKEEPEKAKK